jgi:radical SAM protein with 4Fe4S-binding SPASM domain
MGEIARVPYSEFIHKLVTKKARIPYLGNFELTFRCNLRCIHCYLSGLSLKNELSTQRIKLILDQLAESGCIWLVFTGGEPLMRDDFEEIYIYAVKSGFLITLFSNGVLFRDKTLETLSSFPPQAIEITLYGASKETYQEITGNSEAFEICYQNIKRLVELNLPLRLKTMVMTKNLQDLEKIKEFALNLGLNFRFDSIINPNLKGETSYLDLRLSPQIIAELEKNEPKLIEEFYKSSLKKKIWGKQVYRCGAGRIFFNIDPQGSLQLCPLLRSPRFSLQDITFASAWKELEKELLRPMEDSLCKKCSIFYLCPQCPGTSWLENHTLAKPVDYFCQIAKARQDLVSQKINEKRYAN